MSAKVHVLNAFTRGYCSKELNVLNKLVDPMLPIISKLNVESFNPLKGHNTR